MSLQIDSQNLQTFEGIVNNFGEIYNGLVAKYTLKKNGTCDRNTTRNINTTSKAIKDANKIKKLEELINLAAQRLELNRQIKKVLKVIEGSKTEQLKISSLRQKQLKKCVSVYDWSYIKHFAADDVSSPSVSSLETVRKDISHYALHKTPKKKECPEPPTCTDAYLELPKIKGDKKPINKYKEMEKRWMLIKRVEQIREEFEKWKSTRKEKIKKQILERKPYVPIQLFDMINMGYKPEMDGREDLISLYGKIKHKKIPISSDWKLMCATCCDFQEPVPKTIFKPNNFIQKAVIHNYSIKHGGMNDNAEICTHLEEAFNERYYGKGPTPWIKKSEDSVPSKKSQFSTDKNIVIDPICVREARKEKCRMLSRYHRNLIQYSWEKRGINKELLVNLWFKKIFTKPAKELQELMPGQIPDIFSSMPNYEYMRLLSELFDLIIKNLNDAYATTKLVWDITLVHAFIGIKEKFFQVLENTLVETIIENFAPKLDAEHVKAWKKFISNVFYTVEETYLWNKSPPKRFLGRGARKLLGLLNLKSQLDSYLKDSTLSLTGQSAETKYEILPEMEEQTRSLLSTRRDSEKKLSYGYYADISDEDLEVKSNESLRTCRDPYGIRKLRFTEIIEN